MVNVETDGCKLKGLVCALFCFTVLSLSVLNIVLEKCSHRNISLLGFGVFCNSMNNLPQKSRREQHLFSTSLQIPPIHVSCLIGPSVAKRNESSSRMVGGRKEGEGVVGWWRCGLGGGVVCSLLLNLNHVTLQPDSCGSDTCRNSDMKRCQATL